MSYKRIMVAIDESETSELALKEAISLAKVLQAQLCITHIADIIPAYISTGVSYMPETENKILKAGEVMLNKMKDRATKKGIQAETQLIDTVKDMDSIPAKIITASDEWKADLLVMGTHGRHGLSRLFIGSVAEGVIRRANTPVLLVHYDSEK